MGRVDGRQKIMFRKYGSYALSKKCNYHLSAVSALGRECCFVALIEVTFIHLVKCYQPSAPFTDHFS